MAQTNVSQVRLNFKVLSFLIVSAVFILFLISIYQFNVYTAEVYFINQAQRKITQLSQDNKVLEISLAEANSLGKLDHYAQNFEKAGKIEYLRVLEGTVLAK